MDRSEMRNRIRAEIRCTDYLTPSQYKMYECPFCNSGKGDHKTGQLKVDEAQNLWICYACKRSGGGKTKYKGDVIDLHMHKYGVDYSTALADLWAKIDGGYTPAPVKASTYKAPDTVEVVEADFTPYYEKATPKLGEDAEAQAYLASRGISVENAMKHGLGFDRYADPACHPGEWGQVWWSHATPRIIVPSCEHHYMGRRIDGKEEYQKINTPKRTGSVGIFNEHILYETEDPVFILEGSFDALSCTELGFHAVGLNSINNIDLFFSHMWQKKPTSSCLILCPDHDGGKKEKAFWESFKGLRDRLRNLGLRSGVVGICGTYKDANARLANERNALYATLEHYVNLANQKQN